MPPARVRIASRPMNVEPDDAVRSAQLQLLPLFDDLERVLQSEQDAEALAFFGEIRRWIERATGTEDLMGPFMQLATTAFRLESSRPPTGAWFNTSVLFSTRGWLTLSEKTAPPPAGSAPPVAAALRANTLLKSKVALPLSSATPPPRAGAVLPRKRL